MKRADEPTGQTPHLREPTRARLPFRSGVPGILMDVDIRMINWNARISKAVCYPYRRLGQLNSQKIDQVARETGNYAYLLGVNEDSWHSS